MSTDNKRKLYDALSQDYDMGSYEQFCTDIQDDAKRRKLYDATSEEYDYGDYDKFSNQLGFGPTASAPVEDVTPETSASDSEQQPWKPTDAQKGLMVGQINSALNRFDTKADATMEQTRNMSEYMQRGGFLTGSPVKGDQRFNPGTGEVEQTYITPSGSVTADKNEAERDTRAYKEYVDNMTVAGQLRRAGRDLAELHRKRDERVKAIHDKWKEQQENNTAPLAAVLGAQTYRPSIESDTEYRALTAAIHQAENRIQTLQHENDRQSGKDVGFWRGFREVVGDTKTWDFGYTDFMDAMTMLDASNEPAANRPAKTEEAKRAEQVMLEQISEAQAAEAAYARNDSFWNRAGVMTGEMLPFMLDFAIMGGAKGGSSMVTRNLNAMLLRSVHGAAPKVARNKAVQWTTKALGAMPEDLLYSGVMTNTVQGMKTTADIVDRKLGDVVQNGDGTYDFENDRSWGSAVWQGEANSIIENYSERFGTNLEGVISLNNVGKIAETFGAKRISEVLTKASGSELAGIAGTMQKHLNQLGVSDYVGEVSEEYYGQLWRTMLNLDDAKNAEGRNLFLDGQFHGDIWGGMALSMGLLGAGKYGLSAATYGTMKHRVNKADARASEILQDKWESLRELIDGTTNADIGALSESIMLDSSMTDEAVGAVMSYMEASLNLRGHNLASVAGARDNENHNPDEDAANENYMEGYSATTAQERNDAKRMMEMRRAKLVASLSEDIADEFDADPIGTLSKVYDPEVRRIASDYVNAKMVWDGMIQRVRDDIDGRIAQSDAMIEGRVNSGTGMIHGATLKVDDRQVYIVNGNVATLDDGSVDAGRSDESIIVRDAESGKVEFVDPSQFLGVSEPVDAEAEKEAAREQIRLQYGQEAADEIDGILHFNSEDVYTVLNEAGEAEELTILGQTVDNEGVPLDGMVDVQRADGSISPMSTSDIQQMVDESNARRVEMWESERESSAGESVPATNDDNGVVDMPSTETPEVDAMPVAEEAKPSALSQIPTDENGEPIYEQAEPDAAWDALVEQAEGDEAIASEVVADIIADKENEYNAAEKALKKIEDGKPETKKGAAPPTTAERIAAKRASKEAVANARETVERAKSVLDHWVKIGETVKRRADAVEAERRQEAERLAEEAHIKAEQERAEREEAERIEREMFNGIPDWGYDTPAHARARGYRRNGVDRIDRQSPISAEKGREVEVKFSDGDIPKGRVAIIDAGQLQPSHIQGTRNPSFFLDEAQPKERDDAASVVSARRIAANIRPEEITSSVTAYTGAPTVNARGETIQGNNRSDALRLMWESHPESAARYKQYLMEHAEELGLTAEQIESVENPVLVNMVDVDDDEAIRLGQFVAQDIESGGIERIKPKNAVTRMGGDIRGFAEILLRSADDDASFSQLVAANGVDALAWMSQKGYISPTQYNSALDSKGNLTGEAANDLKGILYQSIFQGGSTRLEEMFNKLPAKAQKAILATAYRDHDSNSADRMIGELQQSILAFNEISSFPGFAEAVNLKDAMAVVEMWKSQYVMDDVTGDSYLPTEKFSNFALHLVAMYRGGTQRFIQGTLNDLFDVVQGVKEDTLFEEADKTPKSLAKAIKKVLDLDYQSINNKENGYNGSNAVGVDTPQGEERGRGSVGDASIGEREPGSSEPTDSGGGTDGDSKTAGAVGYKPIGKGKFGNIFASFRGKAQAAWKFLSEIRSGQARGVFYRPEIGEIDLVWGDAPTDYSGKGLAHIERKHVDTLGDFSSMENAIEVIEDVVKNGEYIEQDDRTAVFDKGNYRVVVARDESGNWVLTAFDHKTSAKEKKKRKDAATTGTAGQPNEEARAVSPNLSDAKVNENFTDKQAGSEKSSDEDFTEEEVKAIVGHTFTHANGDVVKLSGHTIMPNGVAAFTGTLNGKKGARFMDGLVRQMLEPDKGWKSDVVLPTAESATIGEQIAAAEADVNTQPTEGQKKAGNYKKGHVQVGTFDVTIENPKGSVRSGTDADGKRWETTMTHTYGYIRGTEGVDGDHIDVYLSSDIDGWNGRNVFVVDQYNPDGTFDEHKVMLGFNDRDEAFEAYLSNYESGWENGRRLEVTAVNLDDFEKWIESSKRKTKAFKEYAIAKKSAENNSNSPEKGVIKSAEMSDADVSELVSSMKSHAIVMPQIDMTIDNWRDNVDTPLGVVKMGENQKEKLLAKGREYQYGMLLETLSNPDIVLEEPDKEDNIFHERSSSYLFVKTFVKPDGSKYIHFESVTVSQEGMEVSISSHIIRENQLKQKMKSDKLLYKATALDESTNSSAEQPVNKGGSLSSDGKDNALLSEKQADGGQSSDGYTIEPKPYTNKQGKTLDTYIVNFDREFDKSELAAMRSKAKEMKGWRDRESGGWMMRSREDAETFANAVTGSSEARMSDDALPVIALPEHRPVEELAGDSANFQKRESQIALLVEEIGDAIEERVQTEDARPLTMSEVKKMAAKHSELMTISDTDLQELVELAMTQLTRSEALKNVDGSAESQRKAYDRIVGYYRMQPTLSARDSERLIKQQYSTPTPFGYVMGQFVKAAGKEIGSMLEPSAGNGALTIAIRPEVCRVNDIDNARLSNLRKLGFGEVTAQDALLPFGGEAVDAVMTNPPFGTVTERKYDGIFKVSSLEGQMAINALDKMKDDGRAAIVIGGNTSYRTNGSMNPKDAAFFGYLYSHYNVVDVINISGKALYSRNGTGYDVRIVLIDGRKSGEFQRTFPPVRAKARAEQVTTFDELYKRIQDDVLQIQQMGRESGNVQHESPRAVDGAEGANVRGGNDITDDGAGLRPDGASDDVGGSSRTDIGQSVSADDGGAASRMDNADGGDAGSVDNVPRPSAGESDSTGSDGMGDGGRSRGGDGHREAASRPDTGTERPAVDANLETEKVPYPHQSGNGFTLMSVVPAVQAQALKNSLSDIGDVDSFLVEQLGYSSKEELYGYLAAEQIDSVALAINQMNNGNAFIIGDMTGVGKGRQGAALIRYAVKSGRIPIYFTQKPSLFTDNYRDLSDIGSGELKPFMIASDPKDANIVDESGNTVHRLPSKKEHERVLNHIMKHGTLPEGYDYVLTTYDQIKNGTADYQQADDGTWNETGRKLPSKSKGYTQADYNGQARRNALWRLAKGNIVILDESHTVGGDSGCGRYMQGLTAEAKGVTFLSATFAKRADNMPIYAQRTSIAQAEVKPSELIAAISKGGVTLQEIMSKQLVESGQMIRRERSFDGVTIDWMSVPDETNITQRKQFNEVSQIFNDIRNFQDDYVTPVIERMNETAAESGATVGHTKGTKDIGVSNTPFASKMYNLVNQLLFALKADAVADRVIENLRNGFKPVISFTNTMEGFLSEAPKGIEMDEVPNFSVTLMRALDGVMRFTEKDADANSEGGSLTLSQLSPEGHRRYNDIKERIMNMSADLPISPMDAIRTKIEEAGYSVGEITGRTLALKKTPEGKYVVANRVDRDKKANMRDFNSGKLDVLMINKSGSTGISLHSSSRFADQRQRVMVFAQFQSDINDEVQMRGRIDRTGQVHRGKYEYIMSTIPAEQRIQMMFKAKLKSLDANTTSSQKSKFNEMEIVDYLNKYGDEVVWEYMKEHPELEERLGDPLNILNGYKDADRHKENTEKKPNCSALISRYLAFLTVEEQDEIFKEITDAYRVKIQLLDDAGENDLEITTMPLRTRTISKKIWKGGAAPDSGNAFADNTYVEEVEADVLRKPMKRKEIADMTRRLMGEHYQEKNGGVDWKHYVRSQFDDTISPYYRAKAADAVEKMKVSAENRIAKERDKAVKSAMKAREKGDNDFTDAEIQNIADTVEAEARATEEKRQQKRHSDIMAVHDRIKTLMNRLSPERTLVVPHNLKDTSELFEQSFGTFVGFKFNKSYTIGSSTAIFATLDGRRKVELPLSDTGIDRILSASEIAYRYSPKDVEAHSMENWDSKVPTQTRQKRHIITGNILQALVDTEKGERTRGNLISYSTIDGETRQGILMGENFKPTDLRSSAPLSSRLQQIRDGRKVESEKGDVVIERVMFGWQHKGDYEIRVPKSKQRGGIYTMNSDLLKLVDGRNFTTMGNSMVGYISPENIAKAVDMLSRAPFNVTVLQESMLTDAKEDGLRYRADDSMAEANERFNNQLNSYIDGTIGQNEFLHLGKPSGIMKSFLADLPIVMRQRILSKASVTKHNVDLQSLKDMPEYISNPIFVFQRDSNVLGVFTEIKDRDGKNVCVAIELNRVIQDGRYFLEVNDIRSIHGRDSENIIKPILGNNTLRYVDKEKGLAWLSSASSNYQQEIDRQDLESVAKVIKTFENPTVEGEEKLERGGTGAYSDAEVSIENDPWSKAWGESLRSKREQRAFAERERKRMRERVESLSELLGIKIDIVEDGTTLEGRKRNAKGWYDTRTGKITVVVGNHKSTADIEATVLHEAVAHHGLRELLGEHFDEFLDKVYDLADKEVKERIALLASRNGWNTGVAVEEYLASLAENTDFENAKSYNGWWQKIKRAFLDMLSKIGFKNLDTVLTDNELRYILWRSYENMVNPGRYRAFEWEAEDVAMQYSLKVGEYSESSPVTEQRVAEDDDVRYRDGDFTPRDRKLVAAAYERMVSRNSFQVREALQDSMLGLEKLYDAVLEGKTRIEDVAGYENAYLYENRMSSTNNSEQHRFIIRHMRPLLKEVWEICGSDEQERRILVDYMMAKHGLERNVVLAERDAREAASKGADYNEALARFRERDYSGLTALTGKEDLAEAEQEARKMVDDYENETDTTQLWDNVKSATGATLEKLYTSGLLSEERFNQIQGMFEYYIPLQGWDETTSDEVYGYLTANDGPLMGSPIKRAGGRSSKADDPIATIAMMADAAISQGNRNIMKQRFLNFVLGHPTDLVSHNEMWLQYDATIDEWVPVFADLDTSDTQADIERKIAAFEERMKSLQEKEPDKYKRGSEAGNIPYKVVKGRLKEHQILVKRNGITTVLTINGNPRAAQALNGLTNPDVKTGKFYDGAITVASYVNRQLSAFYTTRNPDFVVGNFLRDMLYSNCMTWVKESPSYALKFHKNFGRVNPMAMLRLLHKYENGELDATNHLERMFDQFMSNGGETGYTIVRDIESHKRAIAHELKKQGSIGRKAWSALGMQLDMLNRSAENCARFAAFLTSREMGRSIDRSIHDAKEISVNFNKKGSGGTMSNVKGQKILGKAAAHMSGWGRVLYVFWNAGIQGMTNFGRATKRNPVKALGGAAALFTFGYVIPLLARMAGDGDDDDENAYYNLPEYVRRSNVCFKAGEQWVTIPLPIEYRAIYGMGELASGVISGNERYSDDELAHQMMAQVSQLLPLDMLEGGGGLSPLIPSAVKPFTEAYIMNRGWTGLPVYKETAFNKNDPEWTKAYRSADQHLVEFAKWMNEVSGGDDFKKGKIDINPAKIEYVLNGTFGGLVSFPSKINKSMETLSGKREFEWRNMPLVNRVVKSGDERTANRKLQNEYYKYRDEAEDTRRLYRKYENAVDDGIMGYAEKADFLYNSKEYLRYEIFEEYEPDLKSFREEIRDESNPEAKAALESEMYSVMREMVNALHGVDE